MKQTLIVMLAFLLVLGLVQAASTADTNRLNYWNSEQHTVTVYNDEGSIQTATLTMPTGFSFVSGTGCTNPSGQTISCASIANGGTASFIMSSPTSGVGEYEVRTLTGTMGSTPLPDVKFVRIKDSEIFLTLVEYGRGKGNYFYSSQGKGGSGQEATGCPYVPAGEDFELNYLHKVYPSINNYLGVPTAEGSNIRLTCTYPNSTITKDHLLTGLVIDGSGATANFSSDLVTNSWERLFWIVQQFDAGEFADTAQITINCTDVTYDLAQAHGSVLISADGFNLIFATKTPLSFGAASNVGAIGNGTSEVDITYTFTNNGPYMLSGSTDPIRISIYSPDGADYIGTKGELFGTAMDVYNFEIPALGPSETYTITLTARFDTTSIVTPTVNLSRGATAYFIPCWQINAYNPMTLSQSMTTGSTITIGSTPVAIRGVVERLDAIENNTILLLTNVQEVNATTQSLMTYVVNINNTLTSVQNTVNNIDSTVTTINGTVNNIYVDTQAINEQLDCDTVADTPICQYVVDINNTVGGLSLDLSGITGILNEINATTWLSYNTMQQNFSDLNIKVDNMQLDITSIISKINIMQDYLNCTIATQDSVCYRLQLLENYAVNINTTVGNTETTVNYITNTQLPNINQSIINAINGISLNQTNQITGLSTQIRQLKEFNEESIYLITDSVVESQQQTLRNIQTGDPDATIKSLEKTQTLLDQLSNQITLSSETQKQEAGVMTADIETPGLLGRIMNWINGLWSGLWG